MFTTRAILLLPNPAASPASNRESVKTQGKGHTEMVEGTKRDVEERVVPSEVALVPERVRKQA